MKTITALALLPLLLSACVSSPRKVVLESITDFPPPGAVVEHAVDLGFGFRRVVLAEPVQASFESIGHFEYLCYGNQRLCQVDSCSVSPSGKYAIYQDGPSGKLFLFCPAANNLIQLTSHFVGGAESFQWHEDTKTVDVGFATGWRSKRTFPLQ